MKREEEGIESSMQEKKGGNREWKRKRKVQKIRSREENGRGKLGEKKRERKWKRKKELKKRSKRRRRKL